MKRAAVARSWALWAYHSIDVAVDRRRFSRPRIAFGSGNSPRIEVNKPG
jgi:hypothetical protein